MWLDSSSEMPGRVLTLMVNEPSLKGGKKLRPKVANKPTATTSATPVVPNTHPLWRRAKANARP